MIKVLWAVMCISRHLPSRLECQQRGLNWNTPFILDNLIGYRHPGDMLIKVLSWFCLERGRGRPSAHVTEIREWSNTASIRKTESIFKVSAGAAFRNPWGPDLPCFSGLLPMTLSWAGSRVLAPRSTSVSTRVCWPLIIPANTIALVKWLSVGSFLLLRLFSGSGEGGLLSSGGAQASHCGGFSSVEQGLSGIWLQWLARGLSSCGSWWTEPRAQAQYLWPGLRCSMLFGIFLDLESNLSLLHCQAGPSPLSHQRSHNVSSFWKLSLERKPFAGAVRVFSNLMIWDAFRISLLLIFNLPDIAHAVEPQA